jgi:hypothetical protein
MRNPIAFPAVESAPSTGLTDLNGKARDQFRAMRGLVVSFFEWFGELGLFSGRLVSNAIHPPFEGGELFRQIWTRWDRNLCRWWRSRRWRLA